MEPNELSEGARRVLKEKSGTPIEDAIKDCLMEAFVTDRVSNGTREMRLEIESLDEAASYLEAEKKKGRKTV